MYACGCTVTTTGTSEIFEPWGGLPRCLWQSGYRVHHVMNSTDALARSSVFSMFLTSQPLSAASIFSRLPDFSKLATVSPSVIQRNMVTG